MVQEWWKKLNANERMAATGAIVVLIASLLGGGWISLLGAIAVLVIYWLKYAPSQSITWPAPIQLITLGISAIIGVLALIGLLGLLGLGGLGMFGGFFGGLYIVFLAGVIATAIGAGMMLLGTWREYQAMPKTSPSTPGAPPSGPPPNAPPPSAPPPSAPPPPTTPTTPTT